jgi:hypothetical protein
MCFQQNVNGISKSLYEHYSKYHIMTTIVIIILVMRTLTTTTLTKKTLTIQRLDDNQCQ